jgi:PPOX class probable F420-dependent enzyme
VSSAFPKNPSQADVAAAPVARLATRNPSGAIDVVPVTFALVDDHTVITAVDHKPKRTTRLQRLENIRHEPQVTILVDHYDDDWSSLWWARLRGTATIEDRPSPSMLAPLVAKYPQYQGVALDGPMIRVDIDEIAAWSARGGG